jgi:hypothetical protein
MGSDSKQSHVNKCLDGLEETSALRKQMEEEKEEAERLSQKIQRKKYDCPMCKKSLDSTKLS